LYVDYIQQWLNISHTSFISCLHWSIPPTPWWSTIDRGRWLTYVIIFVLITVSES
jgi:hypothetical protein